jgi:hypothetical protein
MEWNHQRNTCGLLAQRNGLHRQLANLSSAKTATRAERVIRPASLFSRYSKERFMVTEKISNLTGRFSSQIARYGLFTGIMQRTALKH